MLKRQGVDPRYADPRYREALQEILFAGEVQERGWEVKLQSEVHPETAIVKDSSDTLEVNRDSWIVHERVLRFLSTALQT